MKIYHLESEFDAPNCVLALGTFDGVHLGHRKLLLECVSRARELGVPSVCLTFDRHPLSVLRPEAAPEPLMTNAEKQAAIESLGLDVLIERPFTPAYASQTPESFVRGLARDLRPLRVIAGYNYSFGAHGSGNPALLQSLAAQYGFQTTIIPPVESSGAPVSSTRIRSLLRQGRVEEAAALGGGGGDAGGHSAPQTP